MDAVLTATTSPDCIDSATSGIYHVQFMLQHPSDKTTGHRRSHWSPQWNRFSTSPIDGIMDYGDIQLFSPAHIPDPSKFVAWSVAVPLSDPTCHLLGPFDFQPCLLASIRCSIVPPHYWDNLFSLCQAGGIIPLALSPATWSCWLSPSICANEPDLLFDFLLFLSLLVVFPSHQPYARFSSFLTRLRL